MTLSLTSASQRLRSSLRQARSQAGFTYQQAAAALNWAPTKLIAIETGVGVVTNSDLTALLQQYNVTDPARVDEITGIFETSKAEAWSADEADIEYEYEFFHGSENPHFLTLLDTENSATLTRQYQGLNLPGLLQTKEYARKIITTFDPHDSLKRTELGLTIRMKRQQRLQHGLEAHFILHESCLRQRIGSSDTMREQLLQLKNLNGQPNITIQILPFSVELQPSMLDYFMLYELFKPEDDTLDFALVLDQTGQGEHPVHTEPRRINDYLTTFLELSDLAAPQDQLNSFIDPLLDELADR